MYNCGSGTRNRGLPSLLLAATSTVDSPPPVVCGPTTLRSGHDSRVRYLMYHVQEPDLSPLAVRVCGATPRSRSVAVDNIAGSRILHFYDVLDELVGRQSVNGSLLSRNPESPHPDQGYTSVIYHLNGTDVTVTKPNLYQYQVNIMCETDSLAQIKAAVEELLRPTEPRKLIQSQLFRK